MKKLKLAIVIALLGMASLVSAQSASLIVKGGLNMSNYYGSNLSDKNIKPGYHVGIGLDLEFLADVSFQTGLYFTSKGAEYTTNIQLPIHMAYKIDIKPGTKLFIHAGPYFAYGIGGTRSIESKYTADLDKFFGEQEVNTFDKNFGYKPFDIGVGLGIGAEFGVMVIDLGWDMGLKNIARNIESMQVYKPNKKNQSAYLSIGYKF